MECFEQNFNLNFTKQYPKSNANTCRFCFCQEGKNKDANSRLAPITLDLMRSFKLLTKGMSLSLDAELPSKCCKSCSNAITQAAVTCDLVAQSEKKLLKFHKEMQTKRSECEADELLFVDFLEDPDIGVEVETLEEIDEVTNEFEALVEDSEDETQQNKKRRILTTEDGYQISKNTEGKTEYWCTKCNHSFNKKAALDYHFQHASAHNEGNENLFLCPDCGACLYDEINVRRHMKQVHDTLKTPCEYCGREYNAYYMKLHLKKHTGTSKEYQCEICAKTFHANFLKQNHIRKVHTSEKVHNCSHCEEKFCTKKELSKHTLSNHPDQVTNFLCNNCGCRCMSKQGLSAHEKVCRLGTTSTTKPPRSNTSKVKASFALPPDMFSCQFCKKKYADQKKLQDHEERHTKSELSHHCEECNVFFARKDGLTAHILGVHTKDFKHFCKFCSRGFISNAAKVTHERSHTQNRPYVCPNCSKSFFKSHALKQHIEATHRNQRYRCKFCLDLDVIKELRKLVSMVKHVQTVHPEKALKGNVDYGEMLIEDVEIETAAKVNNATEQMIEIEMESTSEI